MRLLALFFALATLAIAVVGVDAAAPVLPTVPGVRDPAVTQRTLSTTVCVPGYSAAVRPSTSYTNRIKRLQIAILGYRDRNPKHYQEDHLISISLGGHPVHARNLWPQPRRQAERDDPIERRLHRAMCNGAMTLREAQKAIVARKRRFG